MGSYTLRFATESTDTTDEDGVVIFTSSARETNMSRVIDDAELPAGLQNPCFSQTQICKGQKQTAVLRRQTQTTQSPRSIALIESLGTAANEPKRNTKSDGTNMLQKLIRLNPPQSYLLVSSDIIKPPEGNTVYQDPSRRKSDQCSEKEREKPVY